MVSSKYVIFAAAAIGLAAAGPALHQPNLWNNDNLIAEMQANCDSGADSMACVKARAMTFLDTVFKQDDYKLTEDVAIKSNGYTNANTGRSEAGLIDTIESYVQSHDVTVDLPVAGAQLTVSPRNMDNDELNFNLKFGSGAVEGKSRKNKHKLRRIATPIMVILLLKAMTIIPMAIGILGLKAFNALKLGFVSFVFSIGLAIFQLCKKLAADHHHPAHISAHGPWESRSFTPETDASAQNMAYRGYA